MTKRILASVLAATMALSSPPAPQQAPAPKPVKVKKSRKGLWIAIGATAAAAVVAGAILAKRIGNER